MSFQAYLDNVKVKTGKTVDEFKTLAQKKGLVKSGEIINWLKADFNLGTGHARAIAHVLAHPEDFNTPEDEKIAAMFKGGKAIWRKTYDEIMSKISGFGPDTGVSATTTYISLLRNGKKFAIVQPTSGRLDIGIKLKSIKPSGRLEISGTWNNMVTHRVRISDPKEVNAEVITWLKQAYETV